MAREWKFAPAYPNVIRLANENGGEECGHRQRRDRGRTDLTCVRRKGHSLNHLHDVAPESRLGPHESNR